MWLADGARDDTALVHPDGSGLTYRDLDRRSAGWRRLLSGLGTRSLVVLFARADVDTVLCYLSCLDTGHAVLCADPRLTPAAVDRLVTAYRPELLVRPPAPPTAGYRPDGDLFRRIAPDAGPPIHDDARLLLLTSGSTGCPKAVTLSAHNLLSNADSIVAALGITRHDRAITSLPLHYCYGLSVLNSHLRAGGSVTLTTAPSSGREFLRVLHGTGVTSVAGVPLTYQALLRSLTARWPTELRSLTQAGGFLAPDLRDALRTTAERHEARLFLMYGQTEATARISVLDARAHPDRVGTVGRAVPGGRLSLAPDGEVLYQGPNVMLGYAADRADLARGDRLSGLLRTGDLGSLSADGFLTLTGRVRRIAKIAGRRVSLDEVEQALGTAARPVAAVPDAAGIVVYCAGDPTGTRRRLGPMCRELGIPAPAVRVAALPELPLTPARKIDYPRLVALTAGAGLTGGAERGAGHG
ncbi:AMP-binding protein [Streptomyces sp. B6B3]|uniref:AMP-binding protein n=1 Tax=Streptomyces sp. B6B3 TaxID=3153570 RepID=UPI00325E2FC8